MAVLFYHADLNVYGGYLGVETFFVISGFLITTILLLDWHTHQRINLKTFWVRRARRLLPALFILLASTLIATALLFPIEFDALTRDAIAALGYATNWYLIFSGQSYFDAGARPSLLQHLWSLAIEEQFYVIWPLVCAIGLRFLRPTGLLVLTIVAALASFGVMALLYDPGADPSRIYYGTDTRATALLIGAALALAWHPKPRLAMPRRSVGNLLDLLGIAALIILLIAYVMLHEQHPLLYRGGLASVALLTALVIAVAVHPAAHLVPWLLEWKPLRWIGVRSYGIYLWHWPLFMITRPGLDVPYNGWLFQTVRFGLAFALAALSYTLVEQPIRDGALGRVWHSFQARLHNQRFGPDLKRQPQPQMWSGVIATSLLAISVICIAVSILFGTQHQIVIASPAPAPAPAATLVSIAAASEPTIQPFTVATATTMPSASTSVMPSGEVPVAIAPLTPATPIDPVLAAELQQILDSAVKDRTIPGIVLTVRLSDGTTWTGASGIANTTDSTPMQIDTLVRIGSLSKMFTAVVVLQLVEEGAISLDMPVSTWFSPTLIPNGTNITVRQLLQHTSGLYDYLEDRKLVSEAYQNPARVWTPEELVRYATQFPASFKPGTPGAWDYSSTNYVILGMMIERVTDHSLEQELRQRIIEPLALTHTYVVPQETVEGPQAHGYSKGTDQTDVSMSFTFGSANIVTTVDDLRVFGDALFSAQLLKPETLKLMQQFVNGKGQYAMPKLEYGLGLMHNRVLMSPDAGEKFSTSVNVIGHIGGFGGFRTALWYAPESNILVVLSVNQAAVDPNELVVPIFEAMLRQGV
jgi:peptidoglycan/LPS O-acetylase OafA/YrhL/CubicO group peptidase (beta-lactamase class C family)